MSYAKLSIFELSLVHKREKIQERERKRKGKAREMKESEKEVQFKAVCAVISFQCIPQCTKPCKIIVKNSISIKDIRKKEKNSRPKKIIVFIITDFFHKI